MYMTRLIKMIAFGVIMTGAILGSHDQLYTISKTEFSLSNDRSEDIQLQFKIVWKLCELTNLMCMQNFKVKIFVH